MILADRIAVYLAANGCTHAYGVVSDESRAIMGAISKRLTLVTMLKEKTCVLAAIHHYRVFWRIAPCLISGGEGALAVVEQAHIEGAPLLVISSNAEIILDTLLETLAPITKATLRPDNALGASFALDGLYKLALTPPHGPVWFDLPEKLAAMDPATELEVIS